MRSKEMSKNGRFPDHYKKKVDMTKAHRHLMVAGLGSVRCRWT